MCVVFDHQATSQSSSRRLPQGFIIIYCNNNNRVNFQLIREMAATQRAPTRRPQINVLCAAALGLNQSVSSETVQLVNEAKYTSFFFYAGGGGEGCEEACFRFRLSTVGPSAILTFNLLPPVLTSTKKSAVPPQVSTSGVNKTQTLNVPRLSIKSK